MGCCLHVHRLSLFTVHCCTYLPASLLTSSLPPLPSPAVCVLRETVLVGEMGMATAPVVCLAAWALFGIQEIGLLIEDPFQVREGFFC